jgi:hypothetical protein
MSGNVMDSLIGALKDGCCRWFQNRDWLPANAKVSANLGRAKGACPGFGMRFIFSIFVNPGGYARTAVFRQLM